MKNAFNSNSKLKAVYFRGTDSHESLLFKKEASIRFVKSPQLGIGEITKLDELSKVIAAGSDTKLICLKKELRYNHDLTLLANAYFLFDITEALSTAENQTERNEGHIFLDTSYEVDNKHDSNLLLDQRQVADYRISSYARYPNTFVEFSWIYLGYVIFVIITVLFTLPFIVRKFKQMEGRIGVLFNKINRIKGGDLSDIQVGVVDNNDDPDELSLISANIDEIALRLSSHMKQIYQSQIKQKDYQIQSIRAQINPHFLYNTLEAIRMKALVNNDDSVAEMLLNTATLYREMIKGDDQVTLEAELTFCDAYLRLFEMRFEDSMFYDISYEDQLKNVLIEKFTLQPLIENYIHHGIDQTRNDNFIEIFCYRKNDDLVAVISNNGRSLSANKLTETLKNLEENANCTENMKMTGLFGVDYRLRSRYGQEYGVQLENLEQGIAVTVRIPIINESEVSIHEGTFSR